RTAKPVMADYRYKSKRPAENDICRFESFDPSHTVRSLRCDFRVCVSHSRELGWHAFRLHFLLIERSISTDAMLTQTASILEIPGLIHLERDQTKPLDQH